MTSLSDLPALTAFTVPTPRDQPHGLSSVSDGAPVTDGNDTLLVANSTLRTGFVQLPRSILHAKGLSRDAKLLYAVLLSYAWQDGSCFPGYERLKGDLGCGINQVTRYMRELEDARLISRRKRGQGKTTVYTLHDLPDQPSAKVPHRFGEAPRVLPRTHQIGDPGTTRSVKAQPPKRRLEQDSPGAETEEKQLHHAPSPLTRATTANHTTDTTADVVALLVECGVTPRTARQLAAAHPDETIRQQIGWHPYRDSVTKNPAGALVRAIRDGWAPPPSRATASARGVPRQAKPASVGPDAASSATPATLAQDVPLRGLWREFAASLRPRLSAATYAAFVSPVLQSAPELPRETRAATLVLPSAFAFEKWHRPPIQAAVAEAADALGTRLTLQAAAGPQPLDPEAPEARGDSARVDASNTAAC